MVLTSVIKCRIYIWGFFSPHPECDTAKTCHWRTTTRHRCENDRRDTPCGQALLGVPSGSRVKLLCPAGASLLEALHGPKGFTDAPPTHTASSRTLQTPFSLNSCEIEAARPRTRSWFWGFGAPGVQGSQAAPWHLLCGAVCPFRTHPKRKIIQLRGATVGTLCPV